jgi:hypothetical protein
MLAEDHEVTFFHMKMLFVAYTVFSLNVPVHFFTTPRSSNQGAGRRERPLSFWQTA